MALQTASGSRGFLKVGSRLAQSHVGYNGGIWGYLVSGKCRSGVPCFLNLKMQRTISRTETTLLGPLLRRLSDKITDFKTTLHFPHLSHLKLICHLVRSRFIAILAHCVEQIQDVSAATEAWSCDARAVSGHGYQFCRELCAATTSPATRQWYSPGQR